MLRNTAGHSVRHLAAQETDRVGEKILYILHAVGAPRCDSAVKGCIDGCSRKGTHNGIPPPVPESAQVCLLFYFYFFIILGFIALFNSYNF